MASLGMLVAGIAHEINTPLGSINSMHDTLTLIHHEIKHNITIHRKFGNIPKIACRLSQLNQIFVNLLINAKQAIKGKGSITIETLAHKGYITIKFTDTGQGIPPEKLNHIFDPGFTTKGVGVGTGLGLSICYQIVQEHHGEISVESEVGKGSTFTVVIPTNLQKLMGKRDKNKNGKNPD